MSRKKIHLEKALRRELPEKCPEMTEAEARGLWVHYAMYAIQQAGGVAKFIEWIEQRTFRPLTIGERGIVEWAVDAFEDDLIETVPSEIAAWGLLEFMRRRGVKEIIFEEGELPKLEAELNAGDKKGVH